MVCILTPFFHKWIYSVTSVPILQQVKPAACRVFLCSPRTPGNPNRYDPHANQIIFCWGWGKGGGVGPGAKTALAYKTSLIIFSYLFCFAFCLTAHFDTHHGAHLGLTWGSLGAHLGQEVTKHAFLQHLLSSSILKCFFNDSNTKCSVNVTTNVVKNDPFLEAMPKMENSVSTAPVRTNQGSSPPENHTKNKTTQPANQHAQDIVFCWKSNKNY